MMTKLQIRLPADVHAELVGRAKAAGRSLNQEMVSRLRASVDDAVRVAGPELLEVDHLFLSAFMRGGRQGAVARGHPEWTPREWLQDSMCFRLAVYMAVDALAKATPASSLPPEVTREERLDVEQLMSFFLMRELREPGSFKVTDREGEH